MQRLNIKRIWAHFSPAFWLLVGAFVSWFTASSYWNPIFIKICEWLRVSANEANNQNMRVIASTAIDTVAFFPLCLSACKRAFSAVHYKNTRAKCFEYIRKNMALILSTYRGIDKKIDANDLNVRVFRKKGHKLFFKDIDGCYSHVIRNKIEFDLNKDEGLVSKAYNSTHPEYEINNSTDDRYNLTPSNRSAIGNLKFIVVIPIVDDRTHVNAVIAIDSTRKVCKSNVDIEKIIQDIQVLAYDLFDLIEDKKEE